MGGRGEGRGRARRNGRYLSQVRLREFPDPRWPPQTTLWGGLQRGENRNWLQSPCSHPHAAGPGPVDSWDLVCPAGAWLDPDWHRWGPLTLRRAAGGTEGPALQSCRATPPAEALSPVWRQRTLSNARCGSKPCAQLSPWPRPHGVGHSGGTRGSGEGTGRSPKPRAARLGSLAVAPGTRLHLAACPRGSGSRGWCA